MHDANLLSCLKNILIAPPGNEEYERSLDELVEGLTNPQFEYNINEQKFLRQSISYMVKSHGYFQRITGGLYSIHPYEVARDIIIGPNNIKNGKYKGINDNVTVSSGLFHDIIEENVELNIKRYVNTKLGYLKNIPIFNRLGESIVKKSKRYKSITEIYHNKEIIRLRKTLNGFVDDIPENKKLKNDILDICNIVDVLTRKGDSDYYNVVGQILKSDLPWENKVRGLLVKLKDRHNNNRTMNPAVKDEPKNFIEKFQRDIARYMRSKESNVKELDSMYKRNDYLGLCLARTKNRISHLFQDFGPYKNIDKIYGTYKNMIIMLQVRAFQKEIHELMDNQAILKRYLSDYISKNEDSKFNDLSYIDNRKGLIELHNVLQENMILCEDVINLKKYFNKEKIYFSNKKRVINETSKLNNQNFFKSDINDIYLYLLSEYANVISDKYNLKLDENIQQLDRIFDYVDKYQINETIEGLSNSNMNSIINSLGYLKRYFIHPRRIYKINARINKYEKIDEITVAKKLGGNILDGYIHRELDKRIKKTRGYSLYKLKSGINKISEARTNIVLRKISVLFNIDKDYTLRGLSFTGLEPYGWGVKLDHNGLLNSCEL